MSKQAQYNRKYKYGITDTVFQLIKLAQGGVCAICRRPPSGRFKELAIDHDHGTGEIRGLLCSNCNRALGLFGDDVRYLEAAVAYLKEMASSK